MTRHLILADVHANLAAFEAVVTAAGAFDECIFLGEVIGFGPQPRECVELLREIGAKVVLGNHDRVALRPTDGQPVGRVSCGDEWELWTRLQLDGPAKTFLRKQDDCYRGVLHGTPFHACHNLPGIAGYVDQTTPDAMIAPAVENIDAPLVFFAHSHVVVDRTVGAKRLVNPGSVGQASDGSSLARFIIWDDDGLHFRTTAYDVAKTLAALNNIPMSQSYRAQWDINYQTGIVCV